MQFRQLLETVGQLYYHNIWSHWWVSASRKFRRMRPPRLSMDEGKWVLWDLREGLELSKACDQSYKASKVVIYDSRVVPDLKITHITTLESQFMIVKCL